MSGKVSWSVKVSKGFSVFILSLTLLILLWAVLLFVKNGIGIPLILCLVFFIILALTLFLHYTHRDRRIIAWMKNNIFSPARIRKYLVPCMVLAVVVGVILRSAFILIGGRYAPLENLSDTGVHWVGGDMIAREGVLSDNVAIYEGFFPYLMTYSATLSLFMKIFGSSVFAIVSSNILFDLLTMLLLYILLSKWKNKQVACIGVMLWALNPLEILYCGVGMAIVATNFFVIASILVAFLCLQSFRKNSGWLNMWGWAALLGICVGLGNAYRPLFTVFEIATVIILLVIAIKRKRRLFAAMSGIVIMIVSTFAVSSAVEFGWSKINPYSIGNTGVGWSFMLGANYDSWGRWNMSDSKFFGERLSKPDIVGEDFLSMQQEFMDIGIQRYLSMGPVQFITHMLHKTEVMFADSRNTTIAWPVLEAYHIADTNMVYQVAHGTGALFLFGLLVCSFIYIYRKLFIQKAYDDTLLLLALCFCGLIAASLLVEVMWRYIMPTMAVLVLLSAPQISYWLNCVKKKI